MGVPAEDARFPDRCVLCNAPAEAFRRRIQVAKDVLRGIPCTTLEIPLCERHRQRQALGQRLAKSGWVVVALALAGAFVSVWLGVAGLVMSLVLLLVGEALAWVVTVVGYREERLWIRVGRPFLSSIPERKELESVTE